MSKDIATIVSVIDHYCKANLHHDHEKHYPSKVELAVKKKGEHFLLKGQQKWARIPHSDIFKGEERTPITRVLIEGGAGLGKTTLCVSMTKGWSSGNCFQEYNLLLFLPLGQGTVASASSVRDLIKSLKLKVNSRDVVKYIQKMNGDGVLLVADGWNELDESKRLQGSFFYNLLFGDLLGSAAVIVTSRPTASAVFHRDNCSVIHRFIEICGFDKENVRAYIQSEFGSTQYIVDSLLHRTEYDPLLQRWCSIPLSCTEVWHVLDQAFRSGLTELCTNVMLRILSSNCQRSGTPVSISSLSGIDHVPQSLRESWWYLCKVAFQLIGNETVDTSQFLSYQIGIMTFGLVDFVDATEDSGLSLNFVYPTSHEYLAALHFVKQLPPSNQLKSLDTIKVTCREFPMFWRYLFGLSTEHKVLLGALKAMVTVESSKCLLCQCAYEAKNITITSEVIKALSCEVDNIKTVIQLSGPSSSLDCDALLYIMSKVKNAMPDRIIELEINFSDCNLSIRQMHLLADILALAPEKMTIKDLDLSDNDLGDESVSHLFTKAASSFNSLKKIFIRKNGIGRNGLVAITSVLAKSSSKTLTQLDLSSNPLTRTGLQALSDAIKSGVLSSLEILFMRDCFTLSATVNIECLNALANGLLTNCAQIRRLDLRDNDFGESATPMVNAAIKKLSRSLDLVLNREYMAEVDNTFVSVMEDTITKKGTIDHTVVHGVIVGPGRSGKNSLMNRLMGKGPLDPGTISPSTGVLENVQKIEVKKLCTVAAAVSNLRWRPLDYDEEALELIMTTAKSHTAEDESVPIGTEVVKIKPKEIVKKGKEVVKNDKKASEETDKIKTSEQNEIFKLSGGYIVQITGDNETRIAISSGVNSSELPLDMFKRAVKLRRMDALREHLESSWTLYLTNTGGQIEFQEHLPLLVCGPSVFFITFPLNQNLNEHYMVDYQYSDGSHKEYRSPSTLMNEILQLLATIAALNCTGPCSDVNIKPRVFFVGTHRDVLPESCVHDRIQQIDKQLQDVVRQTSLFHQDSIEFAFGKEQMIFTVNNLSSDDTDFEKIRLGLQIAVERSKEFTITCPSTWLIFSLILRAKHKSSKVLSYYDCLVIAKRCGITDGMELNKALFFIHNTLGLVRYFCVDELNELVVIDPQILFDTFTKLVTKTFTNDHATVNEIEKFKERGIISEMVIERIGDKSSTHGEKSELPLKWILNLLSHLRIAAPFMIGKEKFFFFPSTLFNAPEQDESPKRLLAIENEPPPLLIAFEGGFCPRGIPGALITYLMTGTNEGNSQYSWELHSNRVFKNQVSFSVGPCDIILKISSTHLEVRYDPESVVSEPSDLQSTCEEVFAQLQHAMKIVTKGYRGCKYHLAFNCTRHECKERPHPAEIDWSVQMVKCKITSRRGRLPKNYHIWIPKGKEAKNQWLNQVIDFQNGSPQHLGKIADIMYEWEGRIADELGLTEADVAAVKTRHPGNLKLQTRTALELWKQKQGNNATYNNLIHLFEHAGYQVFADAVKKLEPNIENVSRNLFSKYDTLSLSPPSSPPLPQQPVFPITSSTVLLEDEKVCGLALPVPSNSQPNKSDLENEAPVYGNVDPDPQHSPVPPRQRSSNATQGPPIPPTQPRAQDHSRRKKMSESDRRAYFSKIFNGCPLHLNCAASWTHPVTKLQYVLFGADEGLFSVMVTNNPDPVMEQVSPRACYWLRVVECALIWLSGNSRFISMTNLILLFQTESQRALQHSRNKQHTKKIPDSKGCIKCCISRNPFSDHRFLIAAVPKGVLLMQWYQPQHTFKHVMLFKCIIPQPLSMLDAFVYDEEDYPVVCFGAKETKDGNIIFDILDLSTQANRYTDDPPESSEVPVLCLQQLEKDTIFLGLERCAKFVDTRGILKPGSVHANQIVFEKKSEHMVYLPNCVLGFHKHGMVGKSLLTQQVTAEVDDGSKVFRLLGSYGTIIIETRPSVDQTAPSNIYILVSEDDIAD